MKIRNRVWTVAMAGMLALAAVGGLTGQALARQKHPVSNDKPCLYINQQTGEWEFYLSGQTITVNGHTLICSADGNWYPWDRTETPPSGPEAPQPIGNAPTTETAPSGPLAPLPTGDLSGS